MNHCENLMLLLRSTSIGVAILATCPSVRAQDRKGPLTPNDSSIVKESNSKIYSTHGKWEAEDSLNFHIIRRWYSNGKLMLFALTDTEKKITYQQEFYVNGQLRERGSLIAYTGFPIGPWEFYEPNGALKETIDHDAEHPVSYSRALQIARENGVDESAPDVSLIEMNGQSYWQVVQWTSRKGRSRAEGVNIDARTGEVTKTSLVGVH